MDLCVTKVLQKNIDFKILQESKGNQPWPSSFLVVQAS